MTPVARRQGRLRPVVTKVAAIAVARNTGGISKASRVVVVVTGRGISRNMAITAVVVEAVAAVVDKTAVFGSMANASAAGTAAALRGSKAAAADANSTRRSRRHRAMRRCSVTSQIRPDLATLLRSTRKQRN